MLRTLDIVLILFMTAVAAVTYTIKHQAEDKLDEVRKIEAEIRLEKDTIDLLRADWALLTQPARLQALIAAHATELQLTATESTQLVRPEELPMLKADLPAKPEDDDKVAEKTTDKVAGKKSADGKNKKTKTATDDISTGSVKR
jgi:hypothetical protein